VVAFVVLMDPFIFDPNIDFLRRCFRAYYERLDLEPPTRFTRREWGFFLFGARNMLRHTKFNTTNDLQKFLINRAPQHSYCSSAYYQDPGLTPMPLKQEGWLGADLIFDLDADHLKDAETMTYEQQLENVKDMVTKLLFKFLIPDFGFKEKDIKLFFSGGRGYHIHVTDPRVLPLDSKDRQEIVDYMTGVGLLDDNLIPKDHYGKSEFQGHVTTKYRRVMYERDAPGWKGRLRRGAEEFIDILATKSQEDGEAFILDLKEDESLKGVIGPTTAKNLYEELFSQTASGSTIAQEIKKDGLLDHLPTGKLREAFFKLIVAYSKIEMSGETDEPVTKDIKRLLRMPLSLHGKTGFKVVRVPLDEIDDFDPLIDAVVFSDKPIDVEITRPTSIKLKGIDYELDVGPAEVPLHLAVFLVAKRAATVK